MIKRYIKTIVLFFLLVLSCESAYALSDDYFVDTIEDKIYEYYVKKTKCIDKDIKIGDSVLFGRFFDMATDSNIYRCDLEWLVLDKMDDKVLLITKHIITMLPYNTYWNPITWEECSLRKWLNEDFYNTSFNDQDKEKIITTANENLANDLYINTKASNTTYDKVFLLSVDEVVKYYRINIDTFKAIGTKFAYAEGLWISKKGLSIGYSVWWLRTVGKNSSHASLVYAGGSIGRIGDGVATKGNGVRPCIWVKI